jgi:DinB family protein
VDEFEPVRRARVYYVRVAELNFERALDVLAGTPPVLSAIMSNLPRSAQDERPSEGAWSPREVLSHLLHSETATMGPRVRRAAEENNLDLATVPAPPQPPPGDARQMSNDWADARAANLSWLRQLTPDQRAHIVQHPRFGKISVDTYLAEWAYHDLDHLRQILSVLAADLYPHIGPFQELYTRPT